LAGGFITWGQVNSTLLRPSGKLISVLNGGYENLIMLMFYLISTVVLWNGGKIARVDQENNPGAVNYSLLSLPLDRASMNLA